MLQGDVRYIVQFLRKTNLEEMIVNSVQQGCHMKMVVHYAVMVLQPHLIYIDERHVRCMLKGCDGFSDSTVYCLL